MARFEDLNDANIRVMYDDAGQMVGFVDPKGAQVGIPLVSQSGGNKRLVMGGEQLPSPYVLFANHTPSSKNDADTVETEVRAFTLPGGTLGKNDTLKITHLWTFPNSATTKALKIYIGNAMVMSFGVTTNNKHQGVEFGRNRNSQLSQVWNNDQAPFGPRPAGILATTIDFTVDQIISFRTTWGTAGIGTNVTTLESALIEVIPGA